jgi:hypothetical protein
METAALVALINGVLALLERLPALVAELKRRQEMTPAEEAALDARIASLRDLARLRRE